MTTPGVEAETSQCQTCKHCNEIEFICKAFPFGIPEEIIRNEVMHKEVLEYQQGDTIYERS